MTNLENLILIIYIHLLLALTLWQTDADEYFIFSLEFVIYGKIFTEKSLYNLGE